jgi:dipeptidyl aminopeptidase/acylaminoacyl peptidase
VATQAATRRTFWRLTDQGATANAEPSRIRLTTGGGTSPRLGPDFIIYLSPQESGDAVWKQQGSASASIWTSPGARMLGAPSIDAEGRRVAFTVRENGRARLYVMNADGTDARAVGGALEWQGTPAWAPDGRTLAASAAEGSTPHLFTVDLDSGVAAPLSGDYALDPVWSPDRRFIVFSGADIGTTFRVEAIGADGSTHTLPPITLTRGARHLRFLPGGHSLVVMKGEIRHKNLWAIDLETGAERQLASLPPDFEVSDFDLSSDGREIVVERTQAHSQIVMLDLSRR